jgi:NAD(P)H-hydrate epimerase
LTTFPIEPVSRSRPPRTMTDSHSPPGGSSGLGLRSLSRDEVRDIDRRAIDEFGLPGIVLMENAGRGAAERLLDLGISGPVVICAGKGNNGGDGFVIARHLDLAGCDARVVLCADSQALTGDAAINYRVVEAAGIPIRVLGSAPDPAAFAVELRRADWIVDALLGTGTRGQIAEPLASLIEAINHSGRRVFAVDLPSGLDCDTGLPLGACVRADHTSTFVAPKRGFDNPDSRGWTGTVHVVDIGVPRKLLQPFLARSSG